MTYWDLVLKEVLSRSNSASVFKFIHRNKIKRVDKKRRSKKKDKKSYPLGGIYNVNFTRREAECMVLLLKGKTIAKVAEILKLSSRTVEFYLKKMKEKLDCHTKSELIGIVAESEFMNNIDFRK